MNLTNLLLAASPEQPDTIAIGIAIFFIFILILLALQALRYGFLGAIIGAFIGPIFLNIGVDEGMMGGAVVFAILGVFGVFQSDKKTA